MTVPAGARVGEERLERRDHLGAHLEAAGADRRPQRDPQVLRARAELGPQGVHRRRQHACHGPAPPGVNRREAPRARIDDQRRNAVGDEHTERHAGWPGSEAMKLGQ